MALDPRISLLALGEADARGAAVSAAMDHVGEAFALAALDGVEPQDLAEAALCAAMCELVAVHGEDGAARIAAQFAERAAAGEFSMDRRQ